LSSGNTYIGSPPETIEIDGAFADWNASAPVPDGDEDVSGGENENVDLAETRLALDDENFSFYVRVDGYLLGGDDILLRPSRPPRGTGTGSEEIVPRLPDEDEDGYPDEEDPSLNDFDNDWIKDPEDWDRDDDGDRDYNWGGNDKWLIQKVTGAKKYIGPIPTTKLPYVSGEDMVLFYVDTDDNISTGYNHEALLVGADILVMVCGREGKIRNATYSTFNSTNGSTPWNFAGNISVGKDDTQLETQISAVLLTPGTHPVVQVHIAGWNGTHDGTEAIIGPMVSRGEDTIRRGMSTSTRGNGVETKSFHLHNGGGMDTFPGSSPIPLTVVKNTHVSWTQTIPFAADLSLDGDMIITMYLRKAGPPKTPNPSTTISIYAGATLVGTASLIVTATTPTLYSYTITPLVTPIPSGEVLTLDYTGNRDTIVWFDDATYDSRIDMTTSTYVNVDSITLYNATAETSTFLANDQISIAAVVSDPLGAQDISGATVSIYYPDSSPLMLDQPMALEATDP
ncbi:MAG: hypothetical protein KAT70_00490, partial [Thermoplasmata archaeon]|nr:hypothetical protein [Thermoplasmata archaeon]